MNKRRYKHGGKGTKLYQVWKDMKQRCLNSKNRAYKYYGGKGITICPEWANDYITFRDWAIQNGYSEELEIDRINFDDNYEPNNCRFITSMENLRNTSHCKITNIQTANEIRVLYATGDYTQKKLALKYGVNYRTIGFIINNKLWKNI